MSNVESILNISNMIFNLIDAIQSKLKKIDSNPNGVNYLLLTELYSLRTRVYIIYHETQFFDLEGSIDNKIILEMFKNIKFFIENSEDLMLLKKLVYLLSMLISSIGVGEMENMYLILNKIRDLIAVKC